VSGLVTSVARVEDVQIFLKDPVFSSILCTCPNQRNLFNLIISIIVGFLTLA